MDTQSESHSEPSSGIRAADLPTPELRNRAKELKAEIRAALKRLPVKLTPTGIEFPDDSLKGIDAKDLRNVTNLINELREILNPTNTIKKLEYFLKGNFINGKPLDTLLEAGSLEAEIEQGFKAFIDGELGFTADLSKLSFPTDPKTLEQLKAGLETGALTGAILTAFPGEADLQRLVMALNAQESKRAAEAKAAKKYYEQKTFTIESLKDMTVTEFLARHFEARGGNIYERDYRIQNWSNLRWEPNDAEIEAGRTTLPAVYTVALYHETAYNRLKPQATLGEVLGTSALSFAFTRKVIPDDTKLLQGVNPNSKKFINMQGDGLKFTRLMNADVNILSPVEWLSLLSCCPNPNDYQTYPTPCHLTPYLEDSVDNLEWLGSINSMDSAQVLSGDGGVHFSGNHPLVSGDHARARSVLRGTTG